MDAALRNPAATSACSNDDAYNTENARIYFGPVRTPERKFATMEDGLAEPLTSDTVPPPTSTTTAEDTDIAADEDNEADDNKDETRVEELVGSPEEGEDDGQDDEVGQDGEIPFSADYVDDEPSSALALRVSSAMGNPSPPPSPTRPAMTLESTGPTSAARSSPEDTTTDANENFGPSVQEAVEPPSASRSPSPAPKDHQAMDVDTVLQATPSAQPDLINFDPLTPFKVPSNAAPSSQNHAVPDSAVSTVDALLLYSPSRDPITSAAKQVNATSSKGSDVSVGDLVAEEGAGSQAPIPPLLLLSPGAANNGPTSETSVLSPLPSSPPTQPLRRSPRKSVALATAALSTTQGSITPRRSTSGPPMKKKFKVDAVIEESAVEGDVLVDSNNTLQTPSNHTTPRGKERRRSKSPLVFRREVGSLSPESSNLLSELVPSFMDKSPLELNAEPAETREPSGEQAVSAQGMQTFFVFSAPPAELPSTPKRSTSPPRPLDMPSLSKFRFQVSVPQNVPETPARRITIERALETGQISPLKASQLGYAPGTTIAENSSIPQTPARRVLVTDKEAPGPSSTVKRPVAPPSAMKQPARFGTPARSETRESRVEAPTNSSSNASRLNSAVPSFARATIASSASAGHSLASSSNVGRTSRLPYPLVGVDKSSNLASSSKEGEPSSSTESTPAKSSLKQPTSRIPRIGAKPYARPAMAAKTAVTKQAPVPTPTSAPPAHKPVTLRKVDLSKPSTTRMVNTVTSRTAPSSSTSMVAKGVGRETSSLRTVVTASSSSNATTQLVAPSAIKRKRSPDLKPPASPIKSRMPPRAAKTAAAAAVAAAPRPSPPINTARAVPASQLGRPRMIRKVVDRISTPPPPPPPVAALESQTHPPPAFQVQPEPASAPPPKAPSPPLTQARAPAPRPVFTQPLPESDDVQSPMKEDAAVADDVPPPAPKPRRRASLIPMPTPVVLPTIQIEPPPMETPPIETLPPQELPLPAGVRRTTRQRKNVSMVDSAPEATQRAASRRKSTQGPRFVFTDAYSEMSATALKQLTNANTMRNQHYLSARLELEVVKRDGLRPESPMVKIKTVAQRQAEEQVTKRSERAERRARRSGESMPGSSDLEMDSDEEGEEGASPRLEEPETHTRGAGEEEDYKTPDRAFRRMKLTESGMRDVESQEKRRVKWDRGLFTVVFIDEVQLGSRQVSKENRPEKGCLAPTVKALRLDTLGNLGSPDDLLPELTPQQITVKKFVYDGEVVEPTVVAPPPPPVAKVTRSRSRKSKS